MTGNKQTFTWEPKDPDEILKRTHDWADRLEEGETITSVEALFDTAGGDIDGGVTIVSSSVVGTVQTTKISGGTPGSDVKMTLRAMIDAGDQIFDTGIKFKVKEW